MPVRRIFPALSAAVALLLAIASSTRAADSDRESKLFAAARGAERILIAAPQHKNAVNGLVDVAPGGQFIVEIERALRGPGNKATSVLIINGGSEKLHPKYINGKSYIFLLKKNPAGKGWINLGTSEIPIKNGKVQYLADGKVVEEVVLDEFEEFSVKDAQPVAEKLATRDALTGKWIVATSNKGMNLFLWLVEFTGKEGPPKDEQNKDAKPADGPEATVKLLSASKVMQAAILKSAEISGNEVHLHFEGDGSSLDFRGQFADGIVRGNIFLGGTVVTPAWMEPTELGNMRKYDSPIPDPALQEFSDATTQENATGALGRFIRRHPDSALALSSYQDLVSLAADDKLDRDKFEKLANEYLTTARRWGPRIELQATIDLGTILSRKEHLPKLALEYLNAATGRFDDDTPIESKKTVGIETGRRLIAAGKVDDGIAALTRVREEFPFDVDVLYALARQAEKDDRIDEALSLFGELQVLPQLEEALIDSQKSSGRKLPIDQSPRRIISRLWTQQHGDTRGLPVWLNGLCDARIKAIAADKLPARGKDEGTRIVLCEFFTGATGAGSVAADVALSALQGAATQSEVVAVRYHVNVPGPDPLANDENQERFKMYGGTTTAMLIVDGRFLPMIGGGMPEAPTVYRRLRTIVETALKDQIDLSLQLSAKAEKGQIAISVKTPGLKNFPPNTRLQVVLVEDRVEFAASNGIRFHDMVARNMPSGAAGVAPVQGALSFKGDIDIAKLKQRLSRQIDKAEREGETPFDAKPLDLNALHLVAFIQNGETAEVLQAASVPVTGLAAPADRTKSDEN